MLSALKVFFRDRADSSGVNRRAGLLGAADAAVSVLADALASTTGAVSAAITTCKVNARRGVSIREGGRWEEGGASTHARLVLKTSTEEFCNQNMRLAMTKKADAAIAQT